MNWRLDVSRNAKKFLEKNNLTVEEIGELAGKAVRYFRGEDINVDIKKLRGRWTGFYRIRAAACASSPSLTSTARSFSLRQSTGEETSISDATIPHLL